MKSIWLDPTDEAAIRALRERYGIDSDSGAIRFALRVLAASPLVQVAVPPPPKFAHRGKPLPAPPPTLPASPTTSLMTDPAVDPQQE